MFQKSIKSYYIGRASKRNVGAVCSPELVEGSTAKSNGAAESRFHYNLSNGNLSFVFNRVS